VKVLIVDDEAPARERLAQLVDDIGSHQVVGGARNGEEALAQVAALRPDVVLMDIRMPGMDGLEAAARLTEGAAPPAVIFVTAYGEHALDAFDARGVDYLLKPVRLVRLEQALEKAGRFMAGALTAHPARAGDSHRSQAEREHVLCRRRGNLELITLDDIYYFHADSKYVTVSHVGGEDLIEDSLLQLEEAFPHRLVRAHRNALVSRQRLLGMEKDLSGRRFVVLRGTERRLEVSRRHAPELRKLLRRLGDADG